MIQVTKDQFYAFIGNKDVVVSVQYEYGDPELISFFKYRNGVVVGKSVTTKPNQYSTYFICS